LQIASLTKENGVAGLKPAPAQVENLCHQNSFLFPRQEIEKQDSAGEQASSPWARQDTRDRSPISGSTGILPVQERHKGLFLML